MENSKLFTSLNNKKGILLQIEEGNLNVSIWKKETPVSTTLDKDSAIKLCEFITLNLRDPVDEEEHQRQINFWANRIEESKNWQPSEEDTWINEGGGNINENEDGENKVKPE